MVQARLRRLEWIAGTNGAGYETQTGFEQLITPKFNFIEQMHNRATSLYLRFPFEPSIDHIKANGPAVANEVRRRLGRQHHG